MKLLGCFKPLLASWGILRNNYSNTSSSILSGAYCSCWSR